MRTFVTAVPVLAVSLFVAAGVRAATLQVGPGQTYTTPCAALAAASAGDEIDIAAGTYTDTCEINPDGIHLKGVGGRPIIDLTNGTPADEKGIYVVNGDDVVIENLELTGAAISDAEGGNGAGLRIQSNGVVVTDCYIHGNQDGILATATTGGGTLTIQFTELADNGLGDACDATSCVHNVYVGTGGGGAYGKLIFQFNWDHALATDTADKGHLLKSRALESDILYNRITGETGHDSYEVDLPNGGLGIVVGNVIEKGTDPDNEILLDYGEEGYGTGTNQLYVAYNTFVNDYTGGTFIDVASGGTLSAAHDNIFAGPGTVSNTGTLSADNLAGTEASFLFNAASSYDYHLTSGSPAIGKAVAPGSAGSFPLTAVFEYVQPTESVARLAASDVGAFEYGTSTTGASDDAGAEAPDGALSGSSSGGSGGGDGGAGSSGGGDGGIASSSSGGGSGSGSSGGGADAGGADAGASGGGASKSSGCGCGVAGASGGTGGLVVAGLVAMGWRRRRSRAR